MKGKELHEAIKDQGSSVELMAEKTKIPRRTLYKILKRESVETWVVDELKKAGLKVPESALVKEPPAVYGPNPELMTKMIETLTEAFQVLKESTNQIIKNNDQMLESNRTMNRLLNSKIDEISKAKKH